MNDRHTLTLPKYFEMTSRRGIAKERYDDPCLLPETQNLNKSARVFPEKMALPVGLQSEGRIAS
jgi:hypothetical protein